MGDNLMHTAVVIGVPPLALVELIHSYCPGTGRKREGREVPLHKALMDPTSLLYCEQDGVINFTRFSLKHYPGRASEG
jgi:hypothetical protein